VLRASFEAITRNWVFKRTFRVGGSSIPIVVTPSAGLRYLLKGTSKVDPGLLSQAMEIVRPGDIVWDVGANVGLFAFAAASLAGTQGKIFAFEPDTWLVELLRKSASLQPNASAKVSVIPVAIAEATALRRFCIAKRSRSSNYLSGYGQTMAGGSLEEHIVPTYSLDSLISFLPRPNVIKIDVEGAELEVLRGATSILQQVRPIVLCEVGDGNGRDVADFLKSQNYTVSDGDAPKADRKPLSIAPWSTIALPN
jgi:FkbM family methyltransferase